MRQSRCSPRAPELTPPRRTRSATNAGRHDREEADDRDCRQDQGAARWTNRRQEVDRQERDDHLGDRAEEAGSGEGSPAGRRQPECPAPLPSRPRAGLRVGTRERGPDGPDERQDGQREPHREDALGQDVVLVDQKLAADRDAQRRQRPDDSAERQPTDPVGRGDGDQPEHRLDEDKAPQVLAERRDDGRQQQRIPERALQDRVESEAAREVVGRRQEALAVARA